MYILSGNMWFNKLMKQFFFGIDQIVYNFISQVYDLLMSIARTSILSQADIIDMADRIYKLLAVFMIFKVTFSLITYVVNPDDFSDKNKGVAKLGTNIIISLSLLILTPYIFNYAYRFQTMVLEDNSLAVLIFGEQGNTDFINTAGDEMAYITMSAFFTPNVSITELQDCIDLQDSSGKFNQKCSGLNDDYGYDGNTKSLAGMIGDDKTPIQNYVIGVEHSSLGLMFRQELAVATTSAKDNSEFIMDYKYIFSTVVGIVIVLLLITFCMDIALRSIKLALLQLIAPIPIISFVDPKSGKDGMFKKWYQMCLKTYLSLFIRLIVIYFAVYIISRLDKLVDIVDGSTVSNIYVKVFIIVGVLMFAKQAPKILEGLGIKLDGDGKFTLNPLKKFEENAIGGKRMTGAAGGMVAGAIGGQGVFGRIGSALTGSLRGAATNKGYSAGLARQAEVNRKMREARINGAGFFGSRVAVLSSRYGLDDADLERDATNLRKDKRAIELKRREVDENVKQYETTKKGKQESIAARKKEVATQNLVKEKISKMEERAKSELSLGHGGSIGQNYTTKKAIYEQLKNDGVAQVAIKNSNGELVGYKDASIDEIKSGQVERYRKALSEEIVNAENAMNDELENATYNYISTVVNGGKNNGKFDNGKTDESLKTMYFEYQEAINKAQGENAKIVNRETDDTEDFVQLTTGKDLHSQMGKTKGSVSYIQTTEIDPVEQEIRDIDDAIRKIQVETQVQISGENDTVSLEKAEQEIKKREQELKDQQDQRKLNRETAKNRRIGGS